MISYAFYYYSDKSDKSDKSDVSNTVDNDIENRSDVIDKTFYNRKFPTKLKYLKESPELMEIADNIRFIRKFSKSRYGDILLNMNSLMKIYIYILSNRYNVVQYIPLFIDIRDNILEILHSLIIIIPETLRHSYGFNPYDEIHKSIDMFTVVSREMLTKLEKYGSIHEKETYIQDNKYKPYNSVNNIFFP